MVQGLVLFPLEEGFGEPWFPIVSHGPAKRADFPGLACIRRPDFEFALQEANVLSAGAVWVPKAGTRNAQTTIRDRPAGAVTR